MTHVRLSDLGPGARAQIADALGQQAKPARGKSRAGIGEADPCPGRCHQCGQHFDRFTLWLRHIRDHHANHGRWDIDLEETP